MDILGALFIILSIFTAAFTLERTLLELLLGGVLTGGTGLIYCIEDRGDEDVVDPPRSS